MRVLVTGGAGYIGSHTVLELVAAGHTPVIVDNFANSSPEALRRIEEISGRQFTFYEADCADASALERIFEEQSIDAVIHFAGLKAVGESVREPLRYYRTNLDTTLTLLETMHAAGVRKLIFSSSATVYDPSNPVPLQEAMPTGSGLTNPYGQTKYMIEQILRDLAVANPDWEITILRYFNPIGAHPSGRIGEDPHGIPNNLLPFIAQTAVGKRDKIMVFGNDYDTPDGTGVRDYIHVVDLARGHLAALSHLRPGATPYNLGSGVGSSVLQMIQAFERACGKTLQYEITSRRSGDVGSSYADPSAAHAALDWRTEKSIDDACADAWRWQSSNPDGYRTDVVK